MLKDQLINSLSQIEEFFNRSTSCLQEKDSGFSPQEGMLNVTHQVAHVAQSIEWFVDGMTSPSGFDMDFEKHWVDVTPMTSLEAARKRFAAAIALAKRTVSEMSEEQLMAPLPEGPVMGGEPKISVIGAISEHTAHHRGALTVYSRLIGYEPRMPYMDA